jgi:hypothetical protein
MCVRAHKFTNPKLVWPKGRIIITNHNLSVWTVRSSGFYVVKLGETMAFGGKYGLRPRSRSVTQGTNQQKRAPSCCSRSMLHGPPKRCDPSELHGITSQDSFSCLFTRPSGFAVKSIESRNLWDLRFCLGIILSWTSRCRGYSGRSSGMGEASWFPVSGKFQLALASTVILGSGPRGTMTIFLWLPTLTGLWDSTLPARIQSLEASYKYWVRNLTEYSTRSVTEQWQSLRACT